jgi:hypothetical protein
MSPGRESILEHDNGAICSPHLRTAEEIRKLARRGGGGGDLILPPLPYITELLYCKIIVNEPNFVLYSYFRNLINIICALLCCRNVLIYVFIRYIVCCSLFIQICAIVVTLRSRKVCDSKIEFSNSKNRMSRVRYIRLHVESADIMCGGDR